MAPQIPSMLSGAWRRRWTTPQASHTQCFNDDLVALTSGFASRVLTKVERQVLEGGALADSANAVATPLSVRPTTSNVLSSHRIRWRPSDSLAQAAFRSGRTMPPRARYMWWLCAGSRRNAARCIKVLKKLLSFSTTNLGRKVILELIELLQHRLSGVAGMPPTVVM